MESSLRSFVEQLSASCLLTHADAESVLTDMHIDGEVDRDQLLRDLVSREKLTDYQASEIRRGKEDSLIIGNYVVLDKLGQGGMGLVLKAQHKRMKRLVALKILPHRLTDSPDAMRRFQREVEAAAKLEHANIVAAYDADEADGVQFLAMQYVDGCNLDELIQRQGPVAARSSGVVHRASSPRTGVRARSRRDPSRRQTFQSAD